MLKLIGKAIEGSFKVIVFIIVAAGYYFIKFIKFIINKLRRKQTKDIAVSQDAVLNQNQDITVSQNDVGDQTIHTKNGQSLMQFFSNYVVIDLETTGYSPYTDKIIEIGALKIENDCVVDSFNTFVNPKCHINSQVSAINHITNKMVDNAETIDVVLPKLIEFLGNSILVGHNVLFDINFISANYQRISKKSLSNDYVDTLRLARKYVISENYKLPTLCEQFNIINESSHRGLNDCYATLKLYQILKEEEKNYYNVQTLKKIKNIKKTLNRELKNSNSDIDDHFAYQNAILSLYKFRGNEEGYSAIKELCLKDIGLFDSNANIFDGEKLHVDSFFKLIIIYEKEKKKAEAIEICEKAIKYGISNYNNIDYYKNKLEKLKRLKDNTQGEQ